MPLPTKNKRESEDSFISRCMSSEIMQKEYSDIKQRYAVCISQFKKG